MSDSIFSELKRRNVFKVAGTYLVVAWLLTQVAASLENALGLPAWLDGVVVVLLLLGFPVALVFAWAFEITPEGVKRDIDTTGEATLSSTARRRLGVSVIGILLVVVGYVIFEPQIFNTEEKSVTAASSSEQANTATGAPDPKGSSIAVLPFVNMSSDPEQEYFSDGISEEILNVLAQLPSLQVTSRSSAFAFKGKDINITEVAEKLGVNNVLEGSVRKSGTRLRITAQLIDADTDKHLWSETYDRELVDIFVVQDEISAAIVKALKSKLDLDVEVVARDMAAVNLDAHNEYLQGRFYIERRTQKDIEKALTHFNKAIEISPDYAPAWMGKAWATLFLSNAQYGNVPNKIALKEARIAAEKAMILDPELPEAQAIMGVVEQGSYENEKAIPYFQRAIELNPSYADAYIWYSLTQAANLQKRLDLLAKAVQLSPMSMQANSNYNHVLNMFGHSKDANEVAQHMLAVDDSSFQAYSSLAVTRDTQGKQGEAAYFSYKASLLNPNCNYSAPPTNMSGK